MGGKRHGRGPGNSSKRPRGGAGGDGGDVAEHGEHQQQPRGWQTLVPSNPLFEKYYRAVTQLLPDEAEWQRFNAALATPLPHTFRITGSRGEAQDMREFLKTTFFSKLHNQTDIEPPRPLDFFPDELFWRFPPNKRDIKKHPDYASFLSYLVQETELGNLSRQEAVSMLPPFFLDVQAGHKVLDSCAAPGSKTAQLIEAVHGDTLYSGEGFPSGMVIANDADLKRCFILIHQTQRLLSPCVAVTHHDATAFPTMFVPRPAGETEGSALRPMQFDRVLCDVPCSSDGTLRKNPILWRRWSPTMGSGLHKLQLRILKRGCELLRVGGRIVYSTCSFNPVENEAVVMQMLKLAQGALELADVSGVLPNLKRVPGLTSWPVMGKSGAIYTRFDDIADSGDRQHLTAAMFPMAPEEMQAAHVERCVRVQPHLHDTGGFFIAVFQKTAPFGSVDRLVAKASRTHYAPGEAPEEEPEVGEAEVEGNAAAAAAAGGDNDGDTEDVAAAAALDPTLEGGDIAAAAQTPNRKLPSNSAARFNSPVNDEPYVFVNPNDADLQVVLQYYGANEHFPHDMLLTRSEGDKGQRLYIVSQSLRDVLLADVKRKVRVLQAGTRVLARNSDMSISSCPYRITQDGLPYVQKFLTGKRVSIPFADLELMVCNHQSEVAKLTPATVAALGESYGPVIFVYEPSQNPEVKGYVSQPLVLCGWRGRATVQVMIVKAVRQSIMWRFLKPLVDYTTAPVRPPGAGGRRERRAALRAAAGHAEGEGEGAVDAAGDGDGNAEGDELEADEPPPQDMMAE